MNGLGRKNDGEKEKLSVFTKETLGVVLVLFSTLCLVCLITRDAIFYTPGKWVNAFLFGLFGYFAYAVVVAVAGLGVLLITDKKIELSLKVKVLISSVFVCLATLLHVVSMSGYELAFGEYLVKSYTLAESGVATATAGGFFTAFIAYVLSSILSEVGCYVVLSIAIVALAYFAGAELYRARKNPSEKPQKFRSTFVKEGDGENATPVELSGVKEYPIEVPELSAQSTASATAKQKLFVNNPQDFAVKSKRDIKKGAQETLSMGYTQGGMPISTPSQSYSTTYSDDLKKKIDYIKTPTTIDVQKTIEQSNAMQKPISSTFVSDYIAKNNPQPTVEPEPVVEIPMFEHEGENISQNTAESNAHDFVGRYANVEEIDGYNVGVEQEIAVPEIEVEIEQAQEQPLQEVGPVEQQPVIEKEEMSFSRRRSPIFEDLTEKPTVEPEPIEDAPASNVVSGTARGILFDDQPKQAVVGEGTVFTGSGTSEASSFSRKTPEIIPQPEPEPKKEKVTPPINRIYHRPPFDLLERRVSSFNSQGEDHAGRMAIIKQTLSDFKIETEPQSYIQGPTVTRYEIMMPAGISVKKVLGFDDDLKMRLESKNGIRIEAPIPGKNLVGIEVANKYPIPVGLREVMEGYADQPSKPGSLIFALGKDIVGNAKTDNLSKGPHYLVAGATGSGKSVCLNVMIISLIMRYSPEELRLILVDPKSVGFRIYEHIPHLMIDEIITEPQKTLSVLQWAYEEMEKRYKTFADCPGVISDIDAYNSEIASATVAKIPRIVIIIDELADLMETCKKEMESKIRALAQKARAAGIHLVLATQRPSVDIITGTIKANLPSRIALKVMNFADSNTILSEGGAEKLLGNGDMLFKNSGMAETERYQGAWISDKEINNVVTYIKENNTAYFDEELQEFLNKSVSPRTEDVGEMMDSSDPNALDEFFLKALWLVVNTGTASISQLQRRFQIGYARAGGLMDKMERMGFVEGNSGSKARKVLLTREEFEQRFGPMDDAY